MEGPIGPRERPGNTNVFIATLQALPFLRSKHRKKPRLSAHDLQSLQERILLDLLVQVEWPRF
jgi:hypothetical protein